MAIASGTPIRHPFRTIMKALPAVGAGLVGVGATAAISGVASGFLSKWLPVNSKPWSYVLSAGSAVAAGTVIGIPRATRKWAFPVFFGGLFITSLMVAKDYILPMLPFKVPGLSGFGDYLTRADAADARDLHGLGDYLTRSDAATARPLGDYLTRSDAATARPLGSYYDYYGEESIADELAGL